MNLFSTRMSSSGRSRSWSAWVYAGNISLQVPGVPLVPPAVWDLGPVAPFLGDDFGDSYGMAGFCLPLFNGLPSSMAWPSVFLALLAAPAVHSYVTPKPLRRSGLHAPRPETDGWKSQSTTITGNAHLCVGMEKSAWPFMPPHWPQLFPPASRASIPTSTAGTSVAGTSVSSSVDRGGVPAAQRPTATAKVASEHERFVAWGDARAAELEGTLAPLFRFGGGPEARDAGLAAWERCGDVSLGGASSSSLHPAESGGGGAAADDDSTARSKGSGTGSTSSARVGSGNSDGTWVELRGVVRAALDGAAALGSGGGGGGFCGARTKCFAAPLDLSAFDGLYLKVYHNTRDAAQISTM